MPVSGAAQCHALHTPGYFRPQDRMGTWRQVHAGRAAAIIKGRDADLGRAPA